MEFIYLTGLDLSGDQLAKYHWIVSLASEISSVTSHIGYLNYGGKFLCQMQKKNLVL